MCGKTHTLVVSWERLRRSSTLEIEIEVARQFAAAGWRGAQPAGTDLARIGEVDVEAAVIQAFGGRFFVRIAVENALKCDGASADGARTSIPCISHGGRIRQLRRRRGTANA